ncbi:type II secretion system protein [Clostridium thermopalmarium]|uniref:Fimbrial protein n=1 Tax=Clostridium thermopalmarium DSM 5974 TaxID=1121340 RepID=A0A2T0AWS1_9CLOT|nr:type II secretion system protein [Clostridium thermopalmarium]PRR75179.1 Fimbrial protein precursor [Clostridium thermopalmarium DSM 5974]PVZ27935.1 type IV pilus assembly protein PilA [Clostridium thermopalmarium DSM 5974]
MKNRKLSKNKKKGFTLIELIIVMSIILVMASFLIPKFNGYRSKAQRLKVVDTGRQIYLAVMDSYIEGNESFSEIDISKATKELLGIDNIEVNESSENVVTVKYEVDKKQYYLEFNKTSTGFKIQDNAHNQIYPLTDSTQVSA